MLERIDTGPRMSQAVVHDSIVYLAGQVSSPDKNIAEQTQDVLEKIDILLNRADSDRDHILSATVWLANIADFAEMNAVWDAWIADGPAPARATCQCTLVKDLLVEITIVAATK